MAEDVAYALLQFIMVLATWSYLYKDNIFSKMSAQIVVSISTVHFFIVKMTNLYQVGVTPIFEQGRILNIIPILVGLLLYFRLSKSWAWVSSYSYAVALGLGTGAVLTTLVSAQVTGLITATIEAPFAGTTLFDTASGLLLVVGVMFALSYWIFTRKFEGSSGHILRIGRLFLMISIGLLYAEDVLWSQSLFVGAMEMVLKFVNILLGRV